MALSQHHHTGRRLPHRHTSYVGLSFIVLLVGVLLTGVTGMTMAEQVTVQAVVVGQVPDRGPVITQPVNGQHFQQNPIDIKGTCSPGLLVNVYKNDVLVGAAICDAGGHFNLKGDLFIGRNELVARMLNTANQQSPDSSPVIAFLDFSSSPGLTGSAVGSHGNVIVSTDSVYKGTVPGQELTWQISIQGGVVPYAVRIDWGDGQTELMTRSGEGEFTIRHTYEKAGGYKGGYVVTINAADTEGTTGTLQIAAIVNNPVGTVSATQVTPPSNLWRLLVAWPLWVILALMLISFGMGEWRQRRADRNKGQGLPQVPGVAI